MAGDIVDFLCKKAPFPIHRNWLCERLIHGSFVCPDRRLLYFETPKAACSTLKWLLADLTGRNWLIRPAAGETSLAMAIHDRSQHPVADLTSVPFVVAHAALTSPDWTRFCVVRNPYARLHSAWAEKIRELSPGYQSMVRAIQGWDPGSAGNGSVQFSSFLRYLISAAPPQLRDDSHWAPMSRLLLPGIIDYTHVLRLETFPNSFVSMMARVAPDLDARAALANRRTNTSLPSDWRAAYDEESAAAACTIAADDFEEFGYDPNSWREASLPTDSAHDNAIALSVVQDRNVLIGALWSRIEMLETELNRTRPWPALATVSPDLPS
jgi:hypothetical protein